MKRFRKSAIALVLALLMALQGTEPIFVQAKEALRMYRRMQISPDQRL